MGGGHGPEGQAIQNKQEWGKSFLETGCVWRSPGRLLLGASLESSLTLRGTQDTAAWEADPAGWKGIGLPSSCEERRDGDVCQPQTPRSQVSAGSLVSPATEGQPACLLGIPGLFSRGWGSFSVRSGPRSEEMTAVGGFCGSPGTRKFVHTAARAYSKRCQESLVSSGFQPCSSRDRCLSCSSSASPQLQGLLLLLPSRSVPSDLKTFDYHLPHPPEMLLPDSPGMSPCPP